jgi:hypothetical protein
MNILPTHTCFDDALDWIVLEMKRDRKRRFDLFLVHGIMQAEDGSLYAHAWVEDEAAGGPFCWDFGLIGDASCAYAVEKSEYYAGRRVQEVTRYTPMEAWRENERTTHYGPWKPEYQALCGGEKRITGSIEAIPPARPRL